MNHGTLLPRRPYKDIITLAKSAQILAFQQYESANPWSPLGKLETPCNMPGIGTEAFQQSSCCGSEMFQAGNNHRQSGDGCQNQVQ